MNRSMAVALACTWMLSSHALASNRDPAASRATSSAAHASTASMRFQRRGPRTRNPLRRPSTTRVGATDRAASVARERAAANALRARAATTRIGARERRLTDLRREVSAAQLAATSTQSDPFGPTHRAAVERLARAYDAIETEVQHYLGELREIAPDAPARVEQALEQLHEVIWYDIESTRQGRDGAAGLSQSLVVHSDAYHAAMDRSARVLQWRYNLARSRAKTPSERARASASYLTSLTAEGHRAYEFAQNVIAAARDGSAHGLIASGALAHFRDAVADRGEATTALVTEAHAIAAISRPLAFRMLHAQRHATRAERSWLLAQHRQQRAPEIKAALLGAHDAVMDHEGAINRELNALRGDVF